MYEQTVGLVARAQRVRLGQAPVKVDLWIYTAKPPASVVDDDNVYKAVTDAMQQAEVYDNDRQICEHHVYRVVKAKDPRIEVTVETTTERTEEET